MIMMFTLMQQIYAFAITPVPCNHARNLDRGSMMMRLAKALLAVFFLTAAAQAQAQSALQDILSSGVLKVGTTGDWNPMTMKDPATNSYTGYDIDVMTQLAQDLGVEVEFVPTDWKTLVSGVTSGKYQITGSASISPARAKAAGYSTSYFSLATVPLILAQNADRFKDWDDLDKEDVTVAATLGTTQEKQVKEFFPNAKHQIVEAPARDFQEVLAGRADAHITSNVEAIKLVEKYPQMMIVPVSAPKAPTPIAMLLPQADQVWINYVNTWIALQKERGFFDELGKKWKLLN
jgi:cyclohexadienyl dehydratase